MINFVPSIGSKPQKFSPEQQRELKKHFLTQTGLGYGGEADLLVYAIVFLAIVAFVSGYFLF